jgi:hypothetical protein
MAHRALMALLQPHAAAGEKQRFRGQSARLSAMFLTPCPLAEAHDAQPIGQSWSRLVYYRASSGPIAQWLEQRTHNPLVPGSSPGGPTKSATS